MALLGVSIGLDEGVVLSENTGDVLAKVKLALILVLFGIGDLLIAFFSLFGLFLRLFGGRRSLWWLSREPFLEFCGARWLVNGFIEGLIKLLFVR